MTRGIAPDERGRDPWVDRLSEYLDDELEPAEREALEAHLAACPACAETLGDLRAVVSRAGALEDAMPAQDLWPAIQAQLGRAPASAEAATAATRERRARAPIEARGRLWWARRFDLSLPQLAAAAVLLVALSAGAVWLALRGATPAPGTSGAVSRSPVASRTPGDSRSPSTPAPAGEEPGPISATSVDTRPADVATLAAVENPRYDAAIAELERALAEGRGQLDPRTLRVVARNLRAIDHALEEARRAVAEDPGNLWLRSHLAATMKRKVDLLRTATQLATAQG